MTRQPIVRRRLQQALVLIGAAVAFKAGAQAVINIDETVTGNQEQPKVLYIVPWKTAADSEEFEQSLAQKTTSRVFEHVEREELLRQLHYLEEKTATDSQ
ncbi:hypothetical protein [Halioxenophilus sp. WMMB6]|uniref:hypothetical protein n=1 Tax=Halioxenophilus sp. WMMB6 TaxID=3073815 RepID=UPI00295EC62D|nr:hypothetical protein [Halioxenophilus sp. WMMB6]